MPRSAKPGRITRLRTRINRGEWAKRMQTESVEMPIKPPGAEHRHDGYH